MTDTHWTDRVVLYQALDRGEIDGRYLAVQFVGGSPRAMAAGQTEETARARLAKLSAPPVDDLV